MVDVKAQLRILNMMRICMIILFSFFSSVSYAVEKIEVEGLFSNKAVLMVDGNRHILAVGEISPEGIKVISADSHGAILEVDGVEKRFGLGNTVSTTFAERKSQQETIFMNSAGMYLTFGSINGRSVRFLVDTGASAIAMNAQQAKQLGIRYDKIGVPAGVSTASGFENAYRIRLKSVSVGKITQTNVEALVIEGNHPGPILLGMTFLGQLNVEHTGNAMTLMQRD
jgi:aspartyl protease family protein